MLPFTVSRKLFQVIASNCSELKVVSWPQPVIPAIPVIPAKAGIQEAEDKQHCVLKMFLDFGSRPE